MSSKRIASKWDGKCRKCGAAHKRGGIVWWNSNQKGVECEACYMGKSSHSETSNNGNDSENEDLKKAQPATLKIGHKLGINIAAVRNAVCDSLHSPECDCIGCYGFKESRSAYVHGNAYITSPLIYAPAMEMPLYDSPNSNGYMANVCISRNNISITLGMFIPLSWIGDSSAPFSIVAGAPEKVTPCDTNIPIQWINGEVTNLATRHTTGKGVPRLHYSDGMPIEKLSERYYINPWYVRSTTFSASLATVLMDGEKFHRSRNANGCNDGCKCAFCGHSVRIKEALGDGDSFNAKINIERDGLSANSVLWIYPEWSEDAIYTYGSPNMILREYNVMFRGIPTEYIETNNRSESYQHSETKETTTLPSIDASIKGVQTSQDLGAAALSLIAALQASAVPEAKVREIAADVVNAELAKIPAKHHKIKFNDAPPMEFEGTMHVMADEIVGAILAGFHNIMVVGPAGSGKTFLFSQVAKILQAKMGWDENDYCASMSCAPGQTESMFIGRMIPSLTTGLEKYHETNLVRLYSKPSGGAFLFDEISNSEPTVMNLVNSMIALDGHVTLPDGRVLERPKNMVVFAADNTWGQGGDRMYIRNQLDAATLDRFTGAKFFMDYDSKLEMSICPTPEVYESVLALRKKAADLKLRRIVSTRAFSAAHKMAINGTKIKDIQRRLTIDWSESDRKAVGV